MNRRDAIKQFALAAGLAGVPVATVKTLPKADEPPAFAVLEYDGHLSMQAKENILRAWEKVNPFPGCKMAVLEEGMRLRFYDRHGRDMTLDVDPT